MKTTKSTFAALIIALLFVSCNNQQRNISSQKAFEDHHTAENSLDWEGTYMGVIPCADCEGIETWLTLNEDLSFTLVRNYLKNEAVLSDTTVGDFEWQKNNVKLQENKPNGETLFFSIEENQVRQLTNNAKEVEGELANHYLLKKTGNPIVENKRWQIVEIFGKTVNSKPDTHYLIFNADENKLEAKANCNIILSPYSITQQYRIKISEGISTMMACEDNLEAELIKALHMADNISFTESTLTLNKGRMSPLLKLKLVEK